MFKVVDPVSTREHSSILLLSPRPSVGAPIVDPLITE
jgi:hypothetical protein